MRLPVREYYRLLEQYLRPQWRMVALLALLLSLSIGLRLLSPLIIRQFIDQAQAGAATATLLRLSLFFLAVTLINQVVRTASAYVTEDVKWRATNWLRDDLSAHCLRLDMGFHNDNTPGAMIERIDGDVTELSNFFSQFVLSVLTNLVFLLGVLFLLFREDWRVGVAFTLFSILMVYGLTRTVNVAVPHWKNRRESSSELFGLVEEWLGGTEDIRASGATGYVQNRMRDAIVKLMQDSRTAWFFGNLTWGINVIFQALGLSMALAMGSYLYLAGEITLGTVFLLVSYSQAMGRPLEQLAHEIRDLQAATAAIDRIRELFDLQPRVQDSAPRATPQATPQAPLPDGPLAVDFERVIFGYGEEVSILRDVSFRLEPGRVMGLLGRTGSGKSTITRLLFRLYDPDGGRVALGGQCLRDVPLADIRHRVGMVTQDVQLFRASVRDNLTFFDGSIPDARILDALAMLGLSAWVERLPHGLDTVLGSGGRSLSAGEAQLLAFTRVFLKDPGLVIMDEASSRLDPATEQLIERAVDRLLRNRSAIIVAHRLATVQRADDILILHDGQIVEYGPRVALVANPTSRFAQLLRTGLQEVLTA